MQTGRGSIQHVGPATCRQFQLSYHHSLIKGCSAVDGAIAPQCPQESRAARQHTAERHDSAVLPV